MPLKTTKQKKAKQKKTRADLSRARKRLSDARAEAIARMQAERDAIIGRIDESSDSAYRLFRGSDTTQRDRDGKRAEPDKWYFEPMYHDGNELFSGPYDSVVDLGFDIDFDIDVHNQNDPVERDVVVGSDRGAVTCTITERSRKPRTKKKAKTRTCPDCSRTDPHVHCPECGDTTHVAADCDMEG